MTTRQADKLIKAGREVTVHNSKYRETFKATFVSRDRNTLIDNAGGVYHRDELQVVS